MAGDTKWRAFLNILYILVCTCALMDLWNTVPVQSMHLSKNLDVYLPFPFYWGGTRRFLVWTLDSHISILWPPSQNDFQTRQDQTTEYTSLRTWYLKLRALTLNFKFPYQEDTGPREHFTRTFSSVVFNASLKEFLHVSVMLGLYHIPQIYLHPLHLLFLMLISPACRNKINHV